MNLFAIEISGASSALIALLNKGVIPPIKAKTYFVFDATWNSDMESKVMTQREMANTYDFYKNSPFVIRLKEVK